MNIIFARSFNMYPHAVLPASNSLWLHKMMVKGMRNELFV